MRSDFLESQPAREINVPFWEAFRFWVKLGLISFGGPTGQIAIMHSEVVEKRGWIDESRFLHALNYCMFLPGPEAQQLAIYIGWLLHGTIGGIVAGALFVIPSIFVLWTLSYVYVTYGKVFWIVSVFYGLKAAVLAIVAAALWRIAQKALKNKLHWSLAALAFVGIFFLKVPFPAVILTAGLIGYIAGKFQPQKFLPKSQPIEDRAPTAGLQRDQSLVKRAVRIILVSLMLWWTPILLSGGIFGRTHTIYREGIFFSKAALVTFGGAYAVLPYVSQQAVEYFRWLRPGQMMDGLALAETTPGPLIMVLQFVGFMGGWNQPGALPQLQAATLGALITTWVTFVPCFLWVFLGAPYIERLRSYSQLTFALSGITAAVVGVVLNLAVWFAIHSLFPAGNIDWFLVIVTLIALAGIIKWRWNIVLVVIVAGILGLLYKSI